MRINVIDTKKQQVSPIVRACGYARVSVDTALSEGSARMQTDYLKRRITSRPGWADCGVFVDVGLSGTGTERPGFQALLEKCRSGEVDLVITKSISRFCRNTVDLLSTIRELKSLNVEVLFDENGISTFTSEGELLITLLASQAQEESRSISQNVLWSIRKKFERGEGIPHDLLGYRWNDSGYEIVEDEAEIVREIFSLYLTGIGPGEISRRLREKGIRGIRGSLISANSVARILRQEKYLGDSILQKTFTRDHITHAKSVNRGERDRFYAEGTHPAIITSDQFDEVQEEITRRQELGNVDSNWKIVKSPFTSKIICRDCGRTFRRKNNRQTNGIMYYKWTCGERIDRRKGSGCESKSVPEGALYELTGEVLGKKDFTRVELDAAVDHILAGAYHEITFVMADGSEITKTWKNRRGAEKCREK